LYIYPYGLVVGVAREVYLGEKMSLCGFNVATKTQVEI
jgi:hypothetical protein